MRGRDFFEKYGFFVDFIFCFFKIIPSSICRFFWDFSKPFSGKLALLLRFFLLKRLARSVGKNVYVGSNVVCKNFSGLTIGDNVSIHDGCYVDAAGSIVIGSNVSIAHHSSLISFEHGWSLGGVPIKYNSVVLGNITIHDDVWLGCGVRVLSGAEIRSRSVFAAGTVVVSGVYEKGYLYGGVPARLIKKLVD